MGTQGVLQAQHEAHKARLARMGGAKPSPLPHIGSTVKKLWENRLFNPEDYYHQMWFWDLVDYRERIEKPSIQNVIEETASYYHISVTDLISHRRTSAIVIPRQVAMYLTKILTLKSYPEIGRKFGNRDHTTVLYAVRKIEAEKNRMPHIGAAVTVLMRKFCR